MLTSETTVEIDRPSRYLVQFCRHAAAMGKTGGGGHSPRNHAMGKALAQGDLRVEAEYDETEGIVTISPLGRCLLSVTGDALALTVEAEDEAALRQIQGIVTRDLERFGRRTGVTVTWPATDASSAAHDVAAPATPRRPSRRTTITLGVLVPVAVAVHLGLGGALLADSRWAGPSIDLILVIVVAKVLLATLGGRAFRRRFGSSNLHRHAMARHHGTEHATEHAED